MTDKEYKNLVEMSNAIHRKTISEDAYIPYDPVKMAAKMIADILSEQRDLPQEKIEEIVEEEIRFVFALARYIEKGSIAEIV